MTYKQRLLASAFGVLAASLSAGASFAQEAAADSNQIGEVVVTAQFRAQNVQETPLAITAVTGDMLQARSQSNIMDVANRTPSVTLTTAGGGLGGSQTTAIQIRGIGQTDFNLALEPGVGLYIDDVYFGTSYGSLMDLLDLDRVEVLRGPQGTLAGKNSEGGAIKLYSKAPSGAGGGYLEGTIGNFKHHALRGGANLTIVPDKLFFRITGMARKQDGYVDRLDYQCATGNSPTPFDPSPPGSSVTTRGDCKIGTDGGRETIALRGALRWIVSDKIEDTLTIDSTIDRSEALPVIITQQGTWLGPNWNTLGAAAATDVTANFTVPRGSYFNYSTYGGLAGTKYAYNFGNINKLDAWGVSNVLDIKISDSLNLKSVSAYRDMQMKTAADTDGSPLSRQGNVWDVDYQQYSQELRLNGSIGERVNWTVGGFYFKYNAIQGGRIPIDGSAQAPSSIALLALIGTAPGGATLDFTFNDPVHVTSKSAFAHLEVNPIEALTITGGVRYTDDYKRYDFTRGAAPGYPGSFFSNSVLAVQGLSGTFQGKRWDWRVTASYKINPDINVYGQVATGFKGGGVNPRPYYAVQVRPFDPEEVTSYEVGFKSFLMDRRIRLNVAGFYNDFKNAQLTLTACPAYIPAGSPPNCALPANVGNATIKGAEVEAELRPTRNLLVDFSASYLDFTWKSVAAATGLTTQNVPPYQPKFKGSLGVQYAIETNFGSFTPRMDYTYQSSQWATPNNFAGTKIGGYGLVNARVTYRDKSGDWQVSLAATNLFDRYYAIHKFYNFPPASSANFAGMIPGRPREVTLSVRRQW